MTVVLSLNLLGKRGKAMLHISAISLDDFEHTGRVSKNFYLGFGQKRFTRTHRTTNNFSGDSEPTHLVRISNRIPPDLSDSRIQQDGVGRYSPDHSRDEERSYVRETTIRRLIAAQKVGKSLTRRCAARRSCLAWTAGFHLLSGLWTECRKAVWNNKDSFS